MAQEKGWIKTPVKAFLREVNLKTEIGTEELLGLSKKKGVLRKKEFEQRSSEAVSYIGYKKVKSGQLISNKMQAWNGMFGISAIDGITSPDYAIYDFSPNVESRFIEYIVRTNLYAGEFLCRSRGMGTGFLRLNPSEFLSTHVWLPDITIQTEIADFLDRETDRIDQLIEKKKLLNSILHLKEKIALRDLLVDIDAKKWRLRHIGKMKNGTGFPTELQGNHNEEVAFFKVKHLQTFGLDNPICNSEDTISRDMAKNLRASIFPKGTIVFAKIGAALLLARFATLGCDACIDNNMAAFVPKKTLINTEFLLLTLTQIDMNTMVQPGTVPSLNTEAFNNFRVPLPTIEQQISLIAEFRSIRNPILAALSKNKSSIEKLREFRTSLITEAVTGQLDINSWKKRGNTDKRLDNIEEAMRT
ncbi:restriction endonuclease subunit S [Legionella pneumophila subsp. fraseri]|uniref:Restriction endonuclease subunit S n=1 Tax=Legionella pneumophila TaxID=446 RepID=A0AAN5R5W7_LEGPN|nr:restriction endonuclease subunit S [Legionella pneumophila]MDW8879661.1 restriction endonuclease subunit S [Legionella pneumophila subsp. fraseri]MDW8962570.1 restriction endonuclease subunit S [Legionella pneumophila subsp. fraseri]HAT1597131.1 restriction endonuclease subunit S [Legionella pneumophila]HAT1739134.1 restriction endonuclease subunit S [Legionella pneumophila]HAT1743798.1 restriction endonuclease subunit S [Legionella pneumophila]